MADSGWQRLWVRILTTTLTITVMVLIFLFSMEPAEKSDQTSGYLSRKAIEIIYPDYDQKPAEEQLTIYDSVQHIVRKTAHFSEYTLLGLMIRLCLESWFGKRERNSFAAWGLGTLYAGTDEMHQILIDGRSGQWNDVTIDSSGVLLGVFAGVLIIRLVNRKAEDRTGKET